MFYTMIAKVFLGLKFIGGCSDINFLWTWLNLITTLVFNAQFVWAMFSKFVIIVLCLSNALITDVIVLNSIITLIYLICRQ